MEKMLKEGGERNVKRSPWSIAALTNEYYLTEEEVESAREIAKRYNIKKGPHRAEVWFDDDAIPEEVEAHRLRFGEPAYPAGINLYSREGIEKLAGELDILLSKPEIDDKDNGKSQEFRRRDRSPHADGWEQLREQ